MNPQPSPTRGSPRDPEDFSIVGLGASAGGLETCKALLGALPVGNGMAFVLIQHLDPTHESMMVDLLTGHTPMKVRQALDGMLVEPDHIYIIPPGAYLSVIAGALRLSQPQERHGARHPFDFLLQSLAKDCGSRAIAVVLSGTGADGSVGIKTVKEKGGLVIAQDPDEATFNGMPQSAISTGVVDFVLPVADIPDALIKHDRRKRNPGDQDVSPPKEDATQSALLRIIELLRMKTAHDFTLYKQGTLRRRIARRMAMAAIADDDMDRYLTILEQDSRERELLADDLLINVTSFFRDPTVFDFLATQIVPQLVRDHVSDHPLRIWIAGCSTGEETYSLAMLFQEEIEAANRDIKLQVFGSDVDPEAIAFARTSLFPNMIEADVSPERLARFFTKEDNSYRVLPKLRSSVVFTVQDVLADPPFSRLDLVSCRNLLIYLRPEAQAKVMSLFDFSLRDGGILLLGSSETVDNASTHFEVISKSERIYRHIGRAPAGNPNFSTGGGDGLRVPPRMGQGQGFSRQAVLGDLCRRLVAEAFAPAAVLINSKYECLYSLGPMDRYLRVAPGHPSHDLLAMARQELRPNLRAAIQQANQSKGRIVTAGGQIAHHGQMTPFNIDIQPASSEGEALLLICFVDEPIAAPKPDRAIPSQGDSSIAELERELETTRTNLKDAIRNLEISSEYQKAINEEALSVNEEYQSTNEELLTSKEELQSLNEELTALNSQLQETLELKRTSSDDLQNVLYSTHVATIFLDTKLNIRFFTPATKTLFSVIASDVGRPLADLNSLASDGTLLNDARTVLSTLTPIELEIEARSSLWYIRRILPYRTRSGGVEGVVITFVDITERKHTADALETAKRQAEMANVAKSRFLAAASHDLRQPLQTLALLQGLLAKTVVGEKAQKLVFRLDETLGAISGMLNTLLDINQIEAGTVRPELVSFPINDLLNQLCEEFTYHAQSQNLTLRMVPCGISVRSDPRLLEQMIRNLLSNAMKYTECGKILLGCRRRKGRLSIEILDTGVGIPEDELKAIFEEYHQLNNGARERSRGLGLGLSIVKRLSDLLGHRINVSSVMGKGSVFAIEIAMPVDERASRQVLPNRGIEDTGQITAIRNGTILIVEDDPELRALIELPFKEEGHRTATAADGIAALKLITNGTIRPDIILTDFNLPKGMNGLQVAAEVRKNLHQTIPAIILTGDISTGTLRDIALNNCVQLNKPVKLTELTQAVQRLLPMSVAQAPPAIPTPPRQAKTDPDQAIIFVVDDDRHVREAIREVLEEDGRSVLDFAACEDFLEAYHPGQEACLVIDAYLPGMSGLELLQRLNDAGHMLPAIMITGFSDVPTAVQAMKAGAVDFIEKPIGSNELLRCVERALELSRDAGKLNAWRETAANHIADLTPRQRQIMDMVLAGNPSKNIAADLGISQRTVENHRASIMTKTGSKSLPALARLALAAAWNDTDKPQA